MKVLVLANFGMGLYNFRKELLEELIKQNYEVYISLPNDKYVPLLEELGCKFIDTTMNRRGTNPFLDLLLLFKYIRILKKIKPDLVLTYTIKPNVYGGIACQFLKIPYIANITGLGTAVENKGLLQKITLMLYKIGLYRANCVFFQNKTNRKFFINNNIIKTKTRLIPGSGVNLEQHRFEKYPKENHKIRFLFVGRIMKAKGIDELFQAARLVKKNYPYVKFEIVGGSEEDYEKEIDSLVEEDIIKYHGQQNDVHSFIKNSHATILPSYHEGMANVLLESASSGRPVLASNIPGCIETFDEGKTGFGFEAKNVNSLVSAIVKFINLPHEKKESMGVLAREKMENEFDRNIVINAYLEEIKSIFDKE